MSLAKWHPFKSPTRDIDGLRNSFIHENWEQVPIIHIPVLWHSSYAVQFNVLSCLSVRRQCLLGYQVHTLQMRPSALRSSWYLRRFASLRFPKVTASVSLL